MYKTLVSLIGCLLCGIIAGTSNQPIIIKLILSFGSVSVWMWFFDIMNEIRDKHKRG